MHWGEHIKQAEKILVECEQDLAIAQSQREWQSLDIQLKIAQTHLMLAREVRQT